MGAPPRGLGQRPSPPQGTEGKEEGCKGPAGLGLEDGGAREAAPAGAFVPQERGQGAAAKRERPSSGAARLAVLHWTHHPLPGFRPWLQSSINLVATATNIQPLSALLFPNTPHTPCSPRTPPPLSRPSPGTGKGNYYFSKQNAVYAEQVESNLCQLLQGVARGLWLAMQQASRGEGERGDFLPLWVLALLVEPGGSLLSWSLTPRHLPVLPSIST